MLPELNKSCGFPLVFSCSITDHLVCFNSCNMSTRLQSFLPKRGKVGPGVCRKCPIPFAVYGGWLFPTNRTTISNKSVGV